MLQFNIYKAFIADRLIEFLAALIKDTKRKVFLIRDNLRVHHSKVFKASIAERKGQIELFYLTSDSSKLIPKDRRNADLKQTLYTKAPVRTKAKLKSATAECMQTLEAFPERVKSNFQDPRVNYSA